MVELGNRDVFCFFLFGLKALERNPFGTEGAGSFAFRRHDQVLPAHFDNHKLLEVKISQSQSCTPAKGLNILCSLRVDRKINCEANENQSLHCYAIVTVLSDEIVRAGARAHKGKTYHRNTDDWQTKKVNSV